MYRRRPARRKAERLIEVTHDALMEGIEAVRPGNTFGDIGAAIQRLCRGAAHARWCATSAATGWGGCSTRRRTCCITAARAPGRCWRPGMFFTIEPMVNLGRPETKVLDDDWTAVTRDKLAVGAVRAFGRRHRGRAARSSPCRPAGKFHPDLPDYELLELVLFRAIPRQDVKPLAKALLDRFGDFNRVSRPARPADGGGGRGRAPWCFELKIVEAAAPAHGAGAGHQPRSCPGTRCWTIATRPWRIARPSSSASSTSTARTC
jgi:hypothetical protein